MGVAERSLAKKSARINNVMATEEEERRRRREEQAALTGLTPEYIDMLERQLARQRGEETPEGAGADYYTPPLTKYAPISGDSRSERTGLMRPVGNILDRLVRPGWQASMNRQQRDLTGQRQAYAEQRPTQAAQQSALLTDSQLEALKQKASDPNATPEERAAATKYLSSYVQALSTRAGGGAVPPWSTIAQKGGEAGRDAGGSARPRSGDPSGRGDPPPRDDALAKPLTGVIGSRTVGENVDYIQHTIDSNNRKVAELQQAIDSGEKTNIRASKGGSYTTTTKMDWDDTEAARQRIRVLENENVELEESLKDPRLSRPAAGSGTATTAPRP
jgi:hypothetical protein